MQNEHSRHRATRPVHFVAAPQMLDPNGCIDENHRDFGRRRLMGLKARLTATQAGQPPRAFTLDQAP